MSEILLKCEVSGCAFSTPRLSAEFYGDMVEHLKVHHLSCHTVLASRSASAISTLPAAASVLPKEEESSSQAADREELEEQPDVNMNNNSIKTISCPEPGCLFKTGYQSNMVRHKKNKHVCNQEVEKFSSPLHTSTPTVKRGRFTGGEVDLENSSKNSKKRRTDLSFRCLKCLTSFSYLEELNKHNNLCCGKKDEESKVAKGPTELKKVQDGDSMSFKGKVEVSGQEVKEEMEGRCEESLNLKWELGGVLCPNCQLKFRSVSELSKHRQLCFKRNKRFVCTTCNKTYLYARGLQRHRRICKTGRGEHDDDESSSSNEESEYEEEVDDNVATCQECEMSFASAAGLEVHQQHCNKKVVYDDVGADSAESEVKGSKNNSMGVAEKASRSMPLVQKNSQCSKCDKTFTSNMALALHKQFFGESCNKTAIGGESEVKRGLGESNKSEESDVDNRKKRLVNSCSLEKRQTDAAAEEETKKTIGQSGVMEGNGSEAMDKAEGKSIKVSNPDEVKDPVTRDCPRETPESKVKMLVDFLSLDGKPFRINLTLPRDCIMQKVLVKIAENFKTGLDQLSFSRKGIELTGDEKAVDYEGEVVVVRPKKGCQ